MGMSEEKIKVIAYSGYRGEETPRAIILHNKKIDVVKILRMWIEETFEEKERKRYYQIKGSDGSLYRIYYHEKAMEWFHIVKD
jgi:hypothetical protein